MSIKWKISLASLVPLAKHWRVPKDRALPGAEEDVPSGPPATTEQCDKAPAGYSQLRVAAHRTANQSNLITGAWWFAFKHNVCIYLLRRSKINPYHQGQESKSQPKHMQRYLLHPSSISSASLKTKLFVSRNREFPLNSCEKEKKSKICRGWRCQGDAIICCASQSFAQKLPKKSLVGMCFISTFTKEWSSCLLVPLIKRLLEKLQHNS